MITNATVHSPFEIIRSFLLGHETARETTLFVVRARFVGPAVHFVAADSRDIYLGSDGCWKPREDARPFKTREAAEAAAQEIRRRIRVTGNRNVSVSVVQYAAAKIMKVTA